MDSKKLKTSWGQMVREGKIKNVLIACLIITNLISATGWFQKADKIVLIPSTLSEQATISPDESSESYVRAWALHVALLVGNITPGNADFVMKNLGEILAPESYRAIRDALAQQIADIKADSLTVAFEPRQVVYEPKTRKTFVYGQFSSRGSVGEPIKVMRTYEMSVETRFGRPWVTRFVPYGGEPKTEGYWTRARPEEIREAEQAKREAAERVRAAPVDAGLPDVAAAPTETSEQL